MLGNQRGGVDHQPRAVGCRAVVGPVVEAPVAGVAGQTAYFSDCILSGTRPESDGEEGLADVRVLRAIEAASLSGQAQKIDTPSRFAHPTPEMIREFPVTDHRLMLGTET